MASTSRLRVVDAILSGTHEPSTSHYQLLRAFTDDETLCRANEELDARGYRTHEFGDSVLIERMARPEWRTGAGDALSKTWPMEGTKSVRLQSDQDQNS